MFVLNINGMSCQNCVRHITEAIHTQDPKARVEVRLNEKRVLVETVAPLEKIRRSIEADGYHITGVEERP